MVSSSSSSSSSGASSCDDDGASSSSSSQEDVAAAATASDDFSEAEDHVGAGQSREEESGKEGKELTKPTAYVRFIARRPCVVIGAALAFQCLCLIIFLATTLTGVLVFRFGDAPLLEDRLHDTWTRPAGLLEAYGESSGAGIEKSEVPGGSQGAGNLYLLYEARGTGGDDDATQVLTADNVKRMREIEAKFLEDPGWLDYCYTGSTGIPRETAANRDSLERTRADCSAGFYSVTNFFYPRLNGSTGAVISDLGTDTDTDFTANFDASLNKMIPPWANPAYGLVPVVVDDGFMEDKDGETRISRSLIRFGLPLQGEDYERKSDETDARRNEIEQWVVENFYEYLKNEASTDTMRVLYIGAVTNYEITQAVFGDLALIGVSIVIILVLIWFISRSFFVAAMGLLQIFSTYPTALVILVFIFQQTYVGILHVMAIFIILGIGADDIFVFVDAFRQASMEEELAGKDVEYRLQWAFSRAVAAMGVTSATTFVAFMMTAVTPFIAISTFGMFSALLVLVNFAMVVSFTPAVLVFWDTHWGGSACLPTPRCVDSEKAAKAPCLAKPDPSQPSLLERFFGDYFGPFVIKYRAWFFFVFGMIACAGIALTGQTQPRSEPFQLMPEGTNFNDALNMLSDFAASDGNLDKQILLVFGIEGIDQSPDTGASPLDPEKRGSVIYNEDFDLGTQAAQERLAEACQLPAKTMSSDPDIKLDTSVKQKCVIDAFYAWYLSQPNVTVPKFGLTGTAFETEMTNFLSTVEGSDYTAEVGLVDDDVKWVVLPFITTLPLETTFVKHTDTKLAWEKMIADFNEETEAQGASLGDGYAWEWDWTNFHIFEMLVVQTFISVAVSLVVAYVILTVFALNYILSTIALVCIVSIVVVFFGMLFLFGWTLGLEETLIGIMMVGLSVDFTVHYVHSYAECPEPGRLQRVQWAFDKLGVSVFSGAVTTVGATGILMASVLLYFFKYGAMLALTVSLSWLYSNFFLMSFLALMGPEKDRGDLRPYVKRIREKIRAKLFSAKVAQKKPSP